MFSELCEQLSSSWSGWAGRPEQESVGCRRNHQPPALSSEVPHLYLATPPPELLYYAHLLATKQLVYMERTKLGSEILSGDGRHGPNSCHIITMKGWRNLPGYHGAAGAAPGVEGGGFHIDETWGDARGWEIPEDLVPEHGLPPPICTALCVPLRCVALRCAAIACLSVASVSLRYLRLSLTPRFCRPPSAGHI